MTQVSSSPDQLPEEVGSLDPQDWYGFRKVAHHLLEKCLDRMESARDLPWQVPGSHLSDVQPLPLSGMDINTLSNKLIDEIMPYATGNTHPRFFGWVHGTGLPVGLLAEMVAATMNSNSGGRDHGAVYIERQVIDWCQTIFEWPVSAGGILTSGTSTATLLALAAARVKVLGKNVRKEGVSRHPEMKVYAPTGTHHCVAKALELMGAGTDALRVIPLNKSTGSMCLNRLAEQLRNDLDAGCIPLCIVGTAGSVDTGRFDQLDEIANFCAEHDIWFHIDGAFGAWIKLANEKWSHLVNGIERADSLAFDFHKWMYVQYDVGAVLVRDKGWLFAAFKNRPVYLESSEEGLAGGEPWYCEQGIELSRGFKALKVWSAMQAHGLNRFGQNISCNCRQAALFGELVQQSDDLELASAVISNICCFRAADVPDGTELKLKHDKIALQLQLSGIAVLSTTMIDGKSALRAAIVNHRTVTEDIYKTVNAVVSLLHEVPSK